MVKSFRIMLIVAVMAMLAVGCSHDENIVVPADNTTAGRPDKDGTETLGPPSIDIATGSGFAVGGEGMVGIAPGEALITVDVPVGAIVRQAILYWSGGSTSEDGGDNTLIVGGTEITGDHIGGVPPTNFFENYYFTAYRYDMTDMGLITDGSNTVTVSGMDFDYSGGSLDENDGVGLLVIYDDDTSADIQVVDGLDLAFYNFAPPLDATVPQTFSFLADGADRVAQLPIMAGSVGAGRPNRIRVTTNGPNGDTEFFNDELGNQDPLWDAIILEVTIPAGATELEVELISPTDVPNGASMSWVAGGLAVPIPVEYCIGDYVWLDMNMDGCQDEGEMGIGGVTVNLWTGCPPVEVIDTTVTGADGYYEFCGLLPGDYTVQFVAPEGHVFTVQEAVGCGPENDSNPGDDGITGCVTIVDADDYTIDAGLYPIDYCIGDFVWYDENGNGCQDEGEMGAEGVEVNLWTGCPPEMVIYTTYTDAMGYYEFCELMPGDYTVQFVAPEGYYFCEQYSGDCDEAHDSNAGPDGITDCVTIVDADDYTIDAALCEIIEEGCTLTIGYWKRHSGVGPQDDEVSQFLPIWLGDDGGAESLPVTTAEMAFDVLQQHTYGHPSNGITKLYAQLLGAKLNFANGASDGDVADIVSDADAFLAMYSWEDWDDLTMEQRDDVLYWHDMLDDYNNGYIGPGHCDDDYDGNGKNVMDYDK